MRSSMVELVAQLRLLTAAGTAEYSIAGVTYWVDDQLQTVLDQHSTIIKSQRLTPQGQYINNQTEYHDYTFPANVRHIERDPRIADGNGIAIGTAEYSIDYDAMRVSFTADTAGSIVFADYRSYDINAAAATVWRAKAAHVAERVDFKTDNHQVSASQYYEHCIAEAKRFEGARGMQFSRFIRTDENWRSRLWDG